jgi:predicted PurR-regulated permease PerM
MTEQPEAISAGSDPDTLNFLTPRLTGRNMLVAIFVLLVIGFLYIARDLLLPISIAFLFSLVLAPVVRSLSRRGIPAPATATAFVAILDASKNRRSFRPVARR